jgi:hypothetical protein
VTGHPGLSELRLRGLDASRRAVRIKRSAVPLVGIMMALTLLPNGAAQGQTTGQSQNSASDLGEFWPLDAPSRKWNLIAHSADHSPRPEVLMSVENETTGPGRFTLWYSHKRAQMPGERDGEQFRVCKTSERTWLFMDSYINSVPGKSSVPHDVVSDKAVYSPSSGVALDLIGNGDYQTCGGKGQPYLLWSNVPPQYRIQVWGHLAENSKLRWYWDALVTKSQVLDDCLAPANLVAAIKVQEAFWSTFKDPAGKWGMGSGAIDPRDSAPSGTEITYGRTVWHGAGQLPYLMTAGSNAPAASAWCVNKIETPSTK